MEKTQMDTVPHLTAVRDFAKGMYVDCRSTRGAVVLRGRDEKSFPRVIDWGQKYFNTDELKDLKNRESNPGRKQQIQEIINAVDSYDPSRQGVFVIDDGTKLRLEILS